MSRCRAAGKELEGLCCVPFWVAGKLETSSAAPGPQPWCYMQASSFYQMLSFCVQKGLLIILIKGGQWIQETIRYMRVLGTDLSLGCL